MVRRFNPDDFKDFKVGDRVWALWDHDQIIKSTVLEISSDGQHIKVKFDHWMAPVDGGQIRTEWAFHWTCVEPLSAVERLAEI